MMKRKWITLILIVAIVIFAVLAGCVHVYTTAGKPQIGLVTTVKLTNLTDVTAKCIPEVVESDAISALVVLHNGTFETLRSTPRNHLEIWKDGAWHLVIPSDRAEKYHVTEVADLVNPGVNYEVGYNFRTFGEKMLPGNYRAIIPFSLNDEEHFIAAEFTVVE